MAGRVLVVDKPLGWTSFDVVNKIRIGLKQKLGIKKIKVGHAGTLDPLATGIVVVCTGKATKGIEGLMAHDKEYEAKIQIGSTTPSFDLETEVDKTYETGHITRELIEKVLGEQFTGEIDQVPPTFSAISIGGKRAYEYARKGREDEIELKARKITISKIELRGYDEEKKEADVVVSCSKGTYIRALARDIGVALGSGAHLTGLRRTRVGGVKIEEAKSMEEIEKEMAAEVDESL